MGSARPKNPHGAHSPYNADTTPPNNPRTDRAGPSEIFFQNFFNPHQPRISRLFFPHFHTTDLPKKSAIETSRLRSLRRHRPAKNPRTIHGGTGSVGLKIPTAQEACACL
jgi:hypothetical protein